MGKQSTRAGKYVFLFLACLSTLFLFHCTPLKESRLKDQEPKPFEDAQQYLRLGHTLLSQKDYEGAIQSYLQVLSFIPHPPFADQALFGIAMVYAHFGYPKRDYKKSIEHLLRILNEYPQSDLAEQARIWVGILIENVESTQKVEKLHETLQMMEKIRHPLREYPKGRTPETKTSEPSLGRESIHQSLKLLAQGNIEAAIGENQKILSSSDPRSPKAEALFNLGLLYAHVDNPQRNVERSIEFFHRLIRTYPKSPWVEQAKTWIGVLQETEELTRLIQKLKQVDLEVEEMKRKK